MTLVPLLLAALVAPVPADTSLVALQARVAAIAASVDGDVGAAAIHLESGVGVATDGDEPFFLASVYKLPIAIALLRRVDAGSVSLGDTVRLGDGYAAAGDREKAIQAYERAAEMDPHGSLGASSASKADDLRRSSS